MRLAQQEEAAAEKARRAELKAMQDSLFALTKKPFWLTATLEDFKKVNKDILAKAKLAQATQEIGPKENLVIGTKAYNRAEVIGALGRTPEEVMAMRRGMTKFQITQSDRRIKDAIEEYIISLENAGKAAKERQDSITANFFKMVQKAGGPSQELHKIMRANLTGKQREEFDKRMLALYNKGVRLNHQQVLRKTQEFFGKPMPSGMLSPSQPTDLGLCL